MRKLVFEAGKCLYCKNCELACALKHAPTHQSRIWIEGDAFFIEAKFCRQCAYPLCAETCIAGALEKENGQVKYRPEKCAFCLSCFLNCPLEAIRPDFSARAILRCSGCAEEEVPPCVAACPTGALSLKELENHLQARRRKHAQASKLEKRWSGK